MGGAAAAAAGDEIEQASEQLLEQEEEGECKPRETALRSVLARIERLPQQYSTYVIYNINSLCNIQHSSNTVSQ